MWRRAVRVVRVIRVAPGHNITPELRSDDNIIYTKVYKGQSLQFCTMRQCGTSKCDFFCVRFYCKKLLHACLYVLVVNKNDMGKAPSPFCIL